MPAERNRHGIPGWITGLIVILIISLTLSSFGLSNDQIVQADAMITDLGTLGGIDSKAFGINASGQVVGYAATADNRQHAFLWSNGAMTDLGVLPGNSESHAFAINDAGQIVGLSSDLGSIAPRACLWQNNALTDLGQFAPRSINNQGDIVGSMSIARNNIAWFEHACLWRNGTLTDLGTLNGDYSYARDINDAGQIVGLSVTRDNELPRAFLWQGSVLTDLGTPGGPGSQASAINSHGLIAGFADVGANAPRAALFNLTTAGGVTIRTNPDVSASPYSYALDVNNSEQVVGTNGHAMLWQNGALTDLNSLLPTGSGWVLESASAINEKGQIAGWGKHNGFTHAFLLNPVSPAPVTTVSAANYDGTMLASEEIVAAFGMNLATTMQAASSTELPISLGGTQVIVRDSQGMDRAARLFFVSPTQVNYLMPVGMSSGPAAIRLINSEATLSLGTAQINTIAPGLFSTDSSGQGLAAALILRSKPDNTQVYEPVAKWDAAQNKYVAVPVDVSLPGEQVYLILFGTGLRHHSGLSAVSARIGELTSNVLYAGTQGFFAGLDQLNVLLPAKLAGRGDTEIMVTVDGRPSNSVSISFR